MQIAIDTETTGLSRKDKPFLVSSCSSEGEIKLYEWEVNPFTRQPKYRKKELRAFEKDVDRYEKLVFLNAKFDIRMLESSGCQFFWRSKVVEVGSMSHLTDSSFHSLVNGKLKTLAKHYLGIETDDEKDLHKAVNSARRIGKKLGWNLGESPKQDYWMPRQIALDHPNLLPEKGWEKGMPVDDHPWMTVCSKYAVLDAERTMELYLGFKEVIQERGLQYILDRENKLVPVLYDMENCGFNIHKEKLEQAIVDLREEQKPHQEYLERAFRGYNPNSPNQTKSIIFDRFKLPPLEFTPKGNPSCNKNALVKYLETDLKPRQRRFIKTQITYNKIKTTLEYLESYKKHEVDGKLYSSLNQNGTSTVRLSSSNPNNQNIKKRGEEGDNSDFLVRQVFGPPPGFTWYCLDYSQLQVACFAYMVGDEFMIQALEDGLDFHAAVATKIFEIPLEEVTEDLRKKAKAVTFGILFGIGVRKLEKQTGVVGIMDVMREQFPKAHEYMKETIERVRRDGAVKTPYGYPLSIPYGEMGSGEHKGVNYEVQGCEGDILKNAMILIHRLLRYKRKFNMIMTVHDELIFQFPNEIYPNQHKELLDKIVECMCKAGEDLGIKLGVDVEFTIDNWKNVIGY